MTVVKFPRAPAPAQTASTEAGWPAAELQRVIRACSVSIPNGAASGWEIGETETGDLQAYLLGPPPDFDCLICISCIGPVFVLEDGNGRLLFEHDNPMLLAEQATTVLRRHKSAIGARIAIAWCAIREAFEEKTDAMLAEPFELLTHLAPQISALA
jgi:hypothetical protein